VLQPLLPGLPDEISFAGIALMRISGWSGHSQTLQALHGHHASVIEMLYLLHKTRQKLLDTTQI